MQAFRWDPDPADTLTAAFWGVLDAEGPAKLCQMLDAQKLQDSKLF